jgi:pimeloyl-ACP methyl ester carboxylesterase
MHSSSRLFPVSLMKAEFAGNLNEDVYELNPRVSPDITVRVAVTRVTDPAWKGRRRPIILLHSEFHNRRQWLSPEGRGVAAHLAEEGFDVWLPEMRGHGLSPVHKKWTGNTLSAIAVEDWPALQEFVAEQSGMAPLWLGLGIGGLSLSYALIHAPAMARSAAGIVLVDCATGHWHRELRRLSMTQRWSISRRGYADGQALKWGVEREPWSLFAEMQGWHGLRKKGQHPVWDQLRAIKLPSLIVGIRDDEADTRAFQGRLGGIRKDLLVIHPRADQDLEGPLGSGQTETAILEWLQHDDFVAERLLLTPGTDSPLAS